MSDFELKLCRNCKYSRLENGSSWQLECLHPKVNATDSWVLSSSEIKGNNARMERESNWCYSFRRKPCGTRGALFESMEV